MRDRLAELAVEDGLERAVLRVVVAGDVPDPSPAPAYFNFADRPTALEEIFAAETLERLRDVKRRYDPDGLISGNHNISLA